MRKINTPVLTLITLFLVSCSSADLTKTPAMSPNIVYKRDMVIDVDGQMGEGFLVVPQKEKYKFHITAPGELDLFTFTTCAREEVAEDAGNVTEIKGIFRRKIEKKKEVKMTYTPNEIERGGGCLVFLAGYEQEKGRHSFGLVDFETKEAKLPAKLLCNGKEIKSNGVSICQSRHGLFQSIIFDSEVKVSPDAKCKIDKEEGKEFVFKLPKGVCTYAFVDKEKKIHRLTTIGYETVPIRK